MTILFKLQPSRICLSLLLSVYSLVILIVHLLPIAEWAEVLFVILLLCALFYYLRRDAWLSLPSSPVAVRIADNEIILLARDGTELSGSLQGNSVVTPLLTVLNILPKGMKRTRSVVIFPDSLGAERFRELRVLLLWAVAGLL